jgi:hypothetical protein
MVVVFALVTMLWVTTSLIWVVVWRFELSAEPVCELVTVVVNSGASQAHELLFWKCSGVAVAAVMVGLLGVVRLAYHLDVITLAHVTFRVIVISLSFVSLLYMISIHVTDLATTRTQEVEQCARQYQIVDGEQRVVVAAGFVLSFILALLISGCTRVVTRFYGRQLWQFGRRVVMYRALYGV